VIFVFAVRKMLAWVFWWVSWKRRFRKQWKFEDLLGWSQTCPATTVPK